MGSPGRETGLGSCPALPLTSDATWGQQQGTLTPSGRARKNHMNHGAHGSFGNSTDPATPSAASTCKWGNRHREGM